MRYSAYLGFETNQTVQIRRIEKEKGNVKFTRCQKALSDNSKDGFFQSDPMTKGIDKLELLEAFKIENQILL